MIQNLAGSRDGACKVVTVAEEWPMRQTLRAHCRMAEKALSISKISQTFGVTEPHVRRCLALAGLCDPVPYALKAGEIGKAMTVSEDEKRILVALSVRWRMFFCLLSWSRMASSGGILCRLNTFPDTLSFSQLSTTETDLFCPCQLGLCPE